MKMMRVLTVIGVASVALSAVSCKEKGPAEKIGEKIDKEAAKVEKKIDKGPAESVGEKIDKGAAKVEDKIKDALDTRPGEAVRDAVEKAKE